MAFPSIPVTVVEYDTSGNPVGAGTEASPSVVSPASGALTNRSGTITTGGTAQAAVAVNAARNYLFIRNPIDATEALWVNLTGAATAASPSVRLDAGDSWEFDGSFIPTNAVSVIAATTGHAFTIWEG